MVDIQTLKNSYSKSDKAFYGWCKVDAHTATKISNLS